MIASCAIAKIVLKNNFKQPAIWLLGLFGVFLGPILTSNSSADGTIFGNNLLYISWSLTLLLPILAILTIIISSDAMAGEFENNTYTALFISPLKSYTLIFGKWLGINLITLCFILLAYFIMLLDYYQLGLHSCISLLIAYLLTWTKLWLLAAAGICFGCYFTTAIATLISFTIAFAGFINNLITQKTTFMHNLRLNNQLSYYLLILVPDLNPFIPNLSTTTPLIINIDYNKINYLTFGFLQTLFFLIFSLLLLFLRKRKDLD